MKDLITVAEFTIKEMLRRKSFIISNIIILVMIVIGFNVPNILKAIDTDEIGITKMLVTDSENIFAENLETLKELKGYEFEITSEKLTFENIKEKIENGEYDEAIIFTSKDEKINIEYIVKNVGMVQNMPEDLMNTITNIYTNMQIQKLALTPQELQALVPNFNLELKQTEEAEVGGNVLAIMLLSIILFYAIYFCAYQVSTSITTEKTSKIMETLVTSTSPKTIVIGKTIGVGIVGLIQIILIILTAVISANLFLEEGMLDQVLDMSNITPSLAIYTGIYFILGYTLYAFLYALTGSTVSKPEDVQSANGPVAIIAVVGFYLSYFTMMNPTSSLNSIAGIIPISSAFCMPFRIMMGIATTKEILISLVVMTITIIIVASISIKIYSSSILNYGSKLSVKEIIKNRKED